MTNIKYMTVSIGDDYKIAENSNSFGVEYIIYVKGKSICKVSTIADGFKVIEYLRNSKAEISWTDRPYLGEED